MIWILDLGGRSSFATLAVLAWLALPARSHAQVPTRGTFELADDAGPLARGTIDLTWFSRDGGVDAAQPIDASAPPDTGHRDSGTFPDASSPADAGTIPGSGGCGIARASGVTSRTVLVNGVTRTFLVSVPAGYSPSSPSALVTGFHGFNWAGSTFRDASLELETTAASHGVQTIFAWPNGTNFTWSFSADVAFYDALRADILANFCVDRTRTFVWGRSMGGGMANTVACARGTELRAGAAFFPFGGGPVPPCARVPFWLYHARDDLDVGIASGRASRDTWIQTNGASAASVPYVPDQCVRYPEASGFDVAWCESPFGGHSPPPYGYNSIWTWFLEHGIRSSTPGSADAGSVPDSSSPDVGSVLDAAPRPDASTPDAGAVADAGPGGGARTNLGTNLHVVTYWSNEQPFADLMKVSQPWTGSGFTTNADGYITSLSPGSRAGTIVNGLGGMMTGDYELLWNGDADLRVFGTTTVVSSAPGRIVFRLSSEARTGANIEFTRVNSSNPPTSVRIQSPGTTASDFFYPPFLDAIRGYAAIRFMGWSRVNDFASFPSWDQRSQASNLRYNQTWGVPVEVMARLANEVGADAWFTMHVAMSDDDVRSYAATACSTLEPGRRVYVEHSNEVWNGSGQFPQYNVVRDQGRALNLDPDVDRAGYYYHVLRTHQIGTIWKEVCGSARVTTVLAGQAAGVWWARQMLNWAQPRGYMPDAFAIAPYFGGGLRPADLVSTDAVFAAFDSRLHAEAESWMSAYRVQVRDVFGLPIYAYEGGQHGLGSTAAEVAVLIAAQLDFRMGAAYRRNRAAWGSNFGAALFLHYLPFSDWNVSGFWGAQRNLSEPCSGVPKCAEIEAWKELR